MDALSLVLFGQALGDGLGTFLLHKPRIAEKINKSIQEENLHLHLSYGEHTQLALYLYKLCGTLEQSHYSAEFSAHIKEQLPLFPKEYIRGSHNLLSVYSQLSRQQTESLSSAILFSPLSAHFHSIEQFLPWLIGYAGMLNKDPYAIAGHIVFGFYLFCRQQGASPEECIQMFAQWRKSSQALQSPVPDQIYWAYQQAIWIGLNYSRRPMMEFVGQHLGITITSPSASCSFSMLPFAIVLAEDKKDFQELCLYLSEPSSMISKSDLMVLAMLSGQVVGTIVLHIPHWISIHNQELLLHPQKWSMESEQEDAKPSVRFPPPHKKEEEQLPLF